MRTRLLAKDEWRKGFAVYENTITVLYEACKPEILGKPSGALGGGRSNICAACSTPSSSKRTLMRSRCASASCWTKASWWTMLSVLKAAVRPEFRITQSGKTWDLSKIDFDKLKEDFKQATLQRVRADRRLCQPGREVGGVERSSRAEYPNPMPPRRERRLREARDRRQFMCAGHPANPLGGLDENAQSVGKASGLSRVASWTSTTPGRMSALR